MSQLILHVGTPKAGSSTIQATLRRSASNLEKDGVYAHEQGGRTLVDFLLGREPELNSGWLREISRYKTFVLSSEMLFSRPDGSKDLCRAIDARARFFDDIKVFAYVRRRDEVAISGYSTAVLGGRTDDFDQPLGPSWLFSAQTAHWERAVGVESILLRRFDVSSFKNNDLVEDFWSVTGLPPSALRIATSKNVSPSLDAIEMQRRLNLIMMGHPARASIARRLFLVPFRGAHVGMSRARRQSIIDADPNAAQVYLRYFGTRTPFSHPVIDDAVEGFQLKIETVRRLTTMLVESEGGACDDASFAGVSTLDETVLRAAEILTAQA